MTEQSPVNGKYRRIAVPPAAEDCPNRAALVDALWADVRGRGERAGYAPRPRAKQDAAMDREFPPQQHPDVLPQQRRRSK